MDSAPSPAEPISLAADQQMLLGDVSWEEYVALRNAYDRPSLVMTYREGVLELTSRSFGHHEQLSNITRLVETYDLLRGPRLSACGGPTLRSAAARCGTEPDACYATGGSLDDDDIPDLVIDVIHRTSFLDKLDVYRGLGIPEVWLFRRGTFELHRHDGDVYTRVECSSLLPELDFTLVATLAARDDQLDALRELQSLLLPSSTPP